jgi:hypothetical protein
MNGHAPAAEGMSSGVPASAPRHTGSTPGVPGVPGVTPGNARSLGVAGGPSRTTAPVPTHRIAQGPAASGERVPTLDVVLPVYKEQADTKASVRWARCSIMALDHLLTVALF